MSDARIADAARAAATPIEAIGATYMLHPDTFKRSEENGYPHPFAGYFAGRGGVLGDVDKSVIEAVFAVFEPGAVETFWGQGQPVHGGAKGASLYQEQVAAWARDHLSGQPGLERIAELGGKVIAAAPVNGLPLYAGWKAMPMDSDAPAKAMQTLFVLRELRGSIHLAAVTAAGLTPVEAHLLNKGAEYCAFFGWPEPFPSVDHLKATRDRVEQITDTRCAEIWGRALSSEEAEELNQLVTALNAAVTPAA